MDTTLCIHVVSYITVYYIFSFKLFKQYNLSVQFLNGVVLLSRIHLLRILLNLLQLNRTSNIAVLRIAVNVDIELSWTCEDLCSRITIAERSMQISDVVRVTAEYWTITPRIQWWWSVCLSVCPSLSLSLSLSLCVSLCVCVYIDRSTWLDSQRTQWSNELTELALLAALD